MKKYYVYIMASKKDGVLYTGITSDLSKRINQHKTGELEGFTKKYFVKKLVYCEEFENAEYAIKREKAIKKWNRDWKINLIERSNPDWNDLSNAI